MSRIKDFYNKYLSRINAYWLVTIVFFALTFVMGDSSLYKRYTYDEKIRSLEKESSITRRRSKSTAKSWTICIRIRKDSNASPVKNISWKSRTRMYILLRTNKWTKSKNDRFQYLRPAVARRCGIISGIAGCSSLPVRHRGCRYNSLLPDNAYQGYGFSQAQIAPLQHICRVAVYIRLRPDVQRTERMDDLPDHFSPASVIHGICQPLKKKLKTKIPTYS